LTEKFRHCYRTETILASVADRAKGCLEYWRRHLDRLASIAYPFRPQEEVDGIRQALKYSADEIWDRAFANHCASRPAVGMQFVLDRAIALVPLELPAYVVLQILDYTPGIETLDELTKVTMISSVRNWRHVSQRMPAVLLRLAAMAREELTSCAVICQAAARCGREARELATQSVATARIERYLFKCASDAAERLWACIAQECRDEGLKHSGGSASTTAAAVARSSNAADESRRATAADFGLREKPGRRKK
jgi:hypothetical protein